MPDGFESHTARRRAIEVKSVVVIGAERSQPVEEDTLVVDYTLDGNTVAEADGMGTVALGGRRED